MEDVIEKDPMEAFPPAKNDEVPVFKNTGDAVVDEWEKAIAEGKTPDIVGSQTDPEVKRWLTAKKFDFVDIHEKISELDLTDRPKPPKLPGE